MRVEDAHLRLHDISKQYRGGTFALNGVTFSIDAGLVALLGPNGAGKTTLMRVLATIHPPTAGTFFWDTHDIIHNPHPLRRSLGYLPQEFGAPPSFTGRQLVSRLAQLRGLDTSLLSRRVDTSLDLVGLNAAGDRAIGTYSGGMRRRLGIAQAIVHEPHILLVDEPTAGLDPDERIRFRTLLAQLAQRCIVLLSTHIVADIEALAQRIIVLAGGRVVSDTTPADMLRKSVGNSWLLTVSPEQYTAVEQTPGYRIVSAVQRESGIHLRLLTQDVAPPADALRAEPTLEDAYLNVIREHTRDSLIPQTQQ